MTRLDIAFWNYDRAQALRDGEVVIDGVEATFHNGRIVTDTHVIVETVVDHSALLRSIGGMDFPHRPGPADGAAHGGGPDPREPRWPKPHEGYYPPFDGGADPEDVIRIRSHDFH